MSLKHIALLMLCPPAIVVAHPLDPLNAKEVLAVRETLSSAGKLSGSMRFASIDLDEPPKKDVLAWKTGTELARRAFAVIYERQTNSTYEAIVDVGARKLVSWKRIPDVQPPMLFEDYDLVQRIVRSDPRWQSAMHKRGIRDLNSIQLDPWSAGNFGWPEEKGERIFRAIAYYHGGDKNVYAHPIEGVIATVDVTAGKVVKLLDRPVVPVPKSSGDYDAIAAGPLRAAPKPLRIEQPQGASFTVEGNEVRWQNWRFRYTFHPREGLVLHEIGYEDRGRVRPILYRASLSEMAVPYADPGPAWYFRNPFDEGEYGLGKMTGPIEPVTDAPANAVLLNALMADESGQPQEFPHLAALYERDGGVLWKHRDDATGTNESRRARDLVLEWIATVGNYDYVFQWIFRQDGSLEMEVGLTGIMEPKAIGGEREETPAHGHAAGSTAHKVTQDIVAVDHQHFFSFRLDMDVDGAANSVVEMNTEAVPPGPLNPHANAFVMREDALKTEQQAMRMCNLASSRKWKVINPSAKNALGEPPGYMLLPGENTIPYADPSSVLRKRAGFLNAHLWVTPYEPSERYAAGDYINQSAGGEGLAKWTQANRPIEDTDIVVWYTLGVTHIPRPEEWPVMPVHRAGFTLIPAGFFTRNPALDVPR